MKDPRRYLMVICLAAMLSGAAFAQATQDATASKSDAAGSTQTRYWCRKTTPGQRHRPRLRRRRHPLPRSTTATTTAPAANAPAGTAGATTTGTGTAPKSTAPLVLRGPWQTTSPDISAPSGPVDPDKLEVSVSFVKADLANVLSYLSLASGVPIVVDGDVKGTVYDHQLEESDADRSV